MNERARAENKKKRQLGAPFGIEYVAMKKYVTLLIAAGICAASLSCPGCAADGRRTSYDIKCAYDAEKGVLGGVCTVNYVNEGPDTDALEFNLHANAYREGALYGPVSEELSGKAFYDGPDYGGMEIISVTGGEWQVCGEDMNILRVALPETLASGKSASVTIEYELELAKVDHRTGITEHTVNLGNFYPIACARGADGKFTECPYYSNGDPFVSDCADYEVTISLPDGYSAAASGELAESEGNARTYSIKNARDFCLVLSDEFKTLSRDVNGTKVRYYYYSDENALKKLDAACDSLAFFEETFGEYAWPTLSVVQTGFAAGGMEYPALTMINGELDESGAVYAIVHENAHQWWYAMTGSDQINCAWQDEGAAEYSALAFFENCPGYGFTRAGLKNAAISSYRAYFAVYDQIFGGADTSMNRHLKDFSGDYEYVNIAYNKALIMFDTLRESIGDERFFGALKSYSEKYRFKTASCDDMIRCFEDTGVDVRGVFESFLEGRIII